MSRERRFVFGEVAELYDEARPGYPPELFDDLLALDGVGAGAAVLEVGAGTGKATVDLARHGLRITALEPNEDMAIIARRNCTHAPNVRVETSTLEDWSAPPGSYDLVAAAQSWHWVDPDAGAAKVVELLRDGGWLALFWNLPVDRGGAVAEQIDAVYADVVPDTGMISQWSGASVSKTARDWAAELAAWPELERSDAREYRWSITYPTDDYLRLMSTHSDHRLLADAQREELLDALGAVIDRNGGQIEVTYATRSFVARRRSRPRA